MVFKVGQLDRVFVLQSTVLSLVYLCIYIIIQVPGTESFLFLFFFGVNVYSQDGFSVHCKISCVSIMSFETQLLTIILP